MKKIILSILLLNFVLIVHSQINWAPIGAEWYINHQEMFPFQAHGYIKYKVLKDTIIDNHKSKLIVKQEVKFNGTHVSGDTLFAYVEDSKVYYYINRKFQMYYDFKVTIGDTVTLSSEIIKCDSISPLIVKRIDSMKIKDVSILSIILGYTSLKYNFDRHEMQISYNSKFSIDVYHPQCALPNGLIVDDFSPPDYLRCYHDSSILYEESYWVKLYPNAKCDTLINDRLNIETIKSSSITTIYPNPTFGKIKIDSREILIDLKVYNIQGKELINIHRPQIKEADLSFLINGTYFLKLSNIKGDNELFKILINK